MRKMTIWQTVVDRPRQLAARRLFFQVHLWAGVLSAVYVIVASVSGSLLMVHDLLKPPGPQANLDAGEQPVGADSAMAALRSSLPGFRVASLVLPQEDGGAYGGFLLSRGQYAFAQVHPVTGDISQVITRQNSWWRFIEDLHNNLLSGRTGRVVNGIGGLSLTLLCLTGIVIWWPGRAGWMRALGVNWNARWPQRLWSLHGAIGMWLLPLTLVITITGVYHTWPQIFRSAVAALLPVSGPEQPLHFGEAERQRPARAGALLDAARNALPDRRVHALQLPATPTAPVRAVMMRPSEHVQAFADTVLLHPATAAVVRIDRYVERPVGDRVLRWLGVLHAGRFAGWRSEVLWLLAGLMMTTIAVTGLAVWWNRVVRNRRWGQRPGREKEPWETAVQPTGISRAPHTSRARR